MGMFNDLKNISKEGNEPGTPTQPKKENKPRQQTPASTPVQKSTSAVKRESNTASKQASSNASTLANNQATNVESIRKTVRRIGKEVTFVRLTPEEKAQLADIIYTYKRQGTKTSENEIARIGLNHLIADYQANGEESVLAQVIAALNA